MHLFAPYVGGVTFAVMVTETQLLRMHSASRWAIGAIEKHMTGLISICVAVVAMLLVGVARLALPMLDAVADIDC